MGQITDSEENAKCKGWLAEAVHAAQLICLPDNAYPSVELTEKENAFSLRSAVPGVDPKDIGIEVTPEYLLVKAETRHEHSEDRGQVHVCEFEAGSMFRSISFPKPVNPDKVKAEFKDGVLNATAEVAQKAAQAASK